MKLLQMMSNKQSFSANKKKVLIISGTRAEFGLLRPVLDALGKSDKLSSLLLITGMHTLKKFGNTQDEVKLLGYQTSKVVPISKNGDMVLWLSEEIKGIYEFCRTNDVDCILVLGDRDESLAGAIVGSHLGIPVGQIHGGDLSGESTVDSKNRNAITQLSTFHFAATNKSARRISEMIDGEKNVFVVGAPGIDLLMEMSRKGKGEVGRKFNLNADKTWFLVVMHPTPLSKMSIKDQIKPVLGTLFELDGEIICIYPNSDTGSGIFIKEIINFSKRRKIKLFENLPREDFVNLLATVDVFIGNSSSGIIESTYLRLPVVNIGDRQKGRERSTNVIDSDCNKRDIEGAIEKSLSHEFKDNCKKAKRIYGNGQTGKKIVTILEKKL